MDWLQWVLLPVSGLLGGIIVDQRSKRNNTAVIEVSKQEAATSARNAASTEFDILTRSYANRHTELTNQVQEQQRQIDELIDQNRRQSAKNRRLTECLEEVLDFLGVVEDLVPAELRPPRPAMHWTSDEEES